MPGVVERNPQEIMLQGMILPVQVDAGQVIRP